MKFWAPLVWTITAYEPGHTADLLFATTKEAVKHLKREGLATKIVNLPRLIDELRFVNYDL